ncbi:MAG: hypothetical protein COB02_14870 [Candidatus Cloacimonadota bacterium]|nr:MAG: hypothetical protein COB02_14870 [Candidatus Cloacimonadota bacterium]
MKNSFQSKGMAIPIVLTFIGILSITVISMLRSSKDEMPIVFNNIKHLQMKYLAKGAMQHARLKLKLLSTEAYDAAAYAVGKNPYFDHSVGYDFTGGVSTLLNVGDQSQREAVTGSGIVTNPGPAFISGTIDLGATTRSKIRDIDFSGTENIWTDTSPLVARNKSLFGFAQSFGYYQPGETTDASYVANLALVRFYEDISSVSPPQITPSLKRLHEMVDVRNWIDNGITTLSNQPNLNTLDQKKIGVFEYSQAAIRVLSGVLDPVTGVPDMFSARYFVKEMKVLATEGNRLYGQEALKVKVRVDLYTRGTKGNTGSAGSSIRGVLFTPVTGFLEETSVFKVARTIN